MSLSDHIIPSREGWKRVAISALPHLQKKEAGPCRDPLVVYCHVPFIIFLGICALQSSMRPGVNIFFASAILLYMSSARYHYKTPSWRTYAVDQVCISWFILSTPAPFMGDSGPLMISGVLAAISLPLKWCEARAATACHDLRHHEWSLIESVGSYWHLGLGAWSAGVMWWYAVPNMSQTEALLVNVVILLFLAEWLIYHFKCEHSRLAAYFGYTELKHGAGGAATTLLTLLAMG